MPPKEKTKTVNESSEASKTVEKVQAPSPAVETKSPAPLGPKVVPQEPSVTFTRWFRMRGKERGYKPHWAEGMQAYTDISGVHTMKEWDAIFKNY
jgi:hypothetical protein